ncbi:iron complex outermembrane receptor protein [Endobacter medicaginis]|uniref:Iron complex outermembrane receptor protein n=1 Tax=Endobacter medicaginis TaxID=1181271 RepID=A0A839V6L9_9PROT|nr:TonB-dependent receptor [Endobacter medicaginis]MBB3175202.1 iron complex outermembrane receptor protein [Endobacter medicaginis]MCX5476787.1 TonB-dependent receptor [Endobacter medicaginis]NVN30634.1 TonB-dependent receptor [Endobacter medicaginis]
MRTTGLLFLLGTTILTCSAGTALAQTAPAAHTADPIADTPINAQSGASTSGSLPTDIARQAQQENITVRGKTPSRNAIGGGLMVHQTAPKSSSTVTQAFIEKQAPGQNPFQLVRLLPGVNSTSPDPLGLTGGNLTMRGLGTSQIGVTLEGVPISDVGSAATYPQEIIDSEDISQINIKQGSADIDSPVVNSSGGTVNIYMRDPLMKAGGTASFSYGSKSATRGFIRLDTGLIGHTNLRGYGSYSYTSSLMWRGPGHDEKQHADLKFVNDWGQGNRVGLSFVYNMLNNNQFPSVSLANWKQYGWGGLNVYSNKWDGTTNTSSTNKNSIANYIGVRVNPFINIYVSAPSTFTLTDHLSFTTAPYLWYGFGNGGGYGSVTDLSKIQYGNSVVKATAYGRKSGAAVFYNPSITETYRPGINSKFTYQTGNNKAVLGYWFEYSKQRQTAPYTPLEGNGNPLNTYGDQQELILSNGQPLEYRNTLTFTRIHTVYAGDSLSLLHNKLVLDAGLKYMNIARDGTNMLPSVKVKYPETRNDGYLPTGSVTYNIDKYNSVFASVTTSFKMPANYNLYEAGTYNTKTGYSTQANLNQRPEVSISEDVGYRYQGPVINASVTYFHYNFTNRQFSTGELINGTLYTTNINAGGQTTDGADFEFGTRPWHNLRPYVSAEVLHPVSDSNINAGNSAGDYVRSAGKIVPFSPQFQTAFALDYDDGTRFGEFNLKYVGHQYADYMNQQSINGYTTLNLSLGYRLPTVWRLKAPTLQMNFLNLLNEHYLDGINSVQTNAANTTGVYGTPIAAKTPTYTVGNGFAWLASLKTDF